MVAYYYNTQKTPIGSCYFASFDPVPSGVLRGGSSSTCQAQTLVLDSDRGELVKAPAARVGKKSGLSEAKQLAALKNHSEAERRRRERINAHLASLRGLLPSTEKMDKATLLAEVISQVRELKKNAMEASKGLLIPLDDDEVKVEAYNNGAVDGTLSFKASICCDYRPELLYDIRQAIDALELKMVNAEISNLGSRLINVLYLTSCRNNIDAEAQQLLVSSILQNLTSVLEKGSASPEYSPRTTLPGKRRRISLFESSWSSS